MTEHHYDEHGRLVRSVTTREVEWDDDERAQVLALLEYEAQACPGCRGWLPETTDSAHAGRYKTAPPIRCHRCDAVTRAQDEHTKRGGQRLQALVAWPTQLS